MSPNLDYRPPGPRLAADGLRGRRGKAYYPHPDLIAAANAALAIGQPLLLTGEAGCGKTDFAFAAATGLVDDPEAGADTGELLPCYVRSDSRAKDLLYHYDALRRFGDAHHGGESGAKRAENPREYVRLEPLGKALLSPRLRVVLIDEIDKAPRDLPNDLLQELDQQHFEIPEIPSDDPAPTPEVDPGDRFTFRHTLQRPEGSPGPLVIITSNVERQLPDPFLRRCVFFHIPFPETEDLRRILEAHLDEGSEMVLDRVVDVFEATRGVPNLTKSPATSEMIDWARALTRVHAPADVLLALDHFAGGPLAEARATKKRWSELPWKALPLLGCLIKLREDRDRLFQEL